MWHASAVGARPACRLLHDLPHPAHDQRYLAQKHPPEPVFQVEGELLHRPLPSDQHALAHELDGRAAQAEVAGKKSLGEVDLSRRGGN